MTILASTLLALSPLGAGEGLGTSELTSGGLVWTFPAGFGSVGQVELGDRGGQVLAQNLGVGWLLSAFDSNPPEPVWQDYIDARILGASETNAFFTATLQADPSGYPAFGIFELRTSSSAGPVWSYSSGPHSFLVQVYGGISRDGRVIVSGLFDLDAQDSPIRVHDPETGAVTRTFHFPVPVSRLALSPDGSVVAVSLGSLPGETRVVELATGAELFSTPGILPPEQGLADAGKVLLVQERRSDGTTHSRAFARESASYREVLHVRAPTRNYEEPIVVDDDGSVVAGAWHRTGSPGSVIVRAFDVATGTTTMEREMPATVDVITRGVVAISADGSRFLVGSTTDGAGPGSSLAMYSPVQDQPLALYPGGGAVYDVDLSPDGERFAAMRSPGDGTSTSRVEMYETGGEDLVVRGRPSIGETIDFALHATPGSSAFLISAPRLAREPLAIPGAGTLHLGPSLLQSDPMGVVPPSGVLSRSLGIANDPAIVGRTSYFQGLTVGPRTLSQDWVQLTILP